MQPLLARILRNGCPSADLDACRPFGAPSQRLVASGLVTPLCSGLTLSMT